MKDTTNTDLANLLGGSLKRRYYAWGIAAIAGLTLAVALVIVGIVLAIVGIHEIWVANLAHIVMTIGFWSLFFFECTCTDLWRRAAQLLVKGAIA